MSEEVAEKMAGEIVLSAEPGKTLRKWRDAFNISSRSSRRRWGAPRR